MAVELVSIRQNCEVTQTELAERMGVSQVTISKLERSDNPTLESVRRYIEALGGEVEVLAVFGDMRATIYPEPN